MATPIAKDSSYALAHRQEIAAQEAQADARNGSPTKGLIEWVLGPEPGSGEERATKAPLVEPTREEVSREPAAVE